MDLVGTFCLSAIVFLSLPLPLFASAALGACPFLRRSLMPWVWAHVVVGSMIGILIIATTVQPFVALVVASASFVLCGIQMFRRVALVNNSMT